MKETKTKEKNMSRSKAKKTRISFKPFGLNLRSLLLISIFALTGAALLGTGFAAKGGGGNTSSFVWKPYNVQIMNPVEQWIEWPFPPSSQWVTNSAATVSPPGPCAWDVDDTWYQIAMGTINPGNTVKTDHCRVADPNPIWQIRNGHAAWWSTNPRYMGVRIQSASRDLAVTISYSPQNRDFTLLPVYDSGTKQYTYRGCVALRYQPNDPNWPYERDEAVQPIPGSNGGWGVITHATVNVTNRSSRKVNATGKVEELAAWISDDTVASYCSAKRSIHDEWQHEYPFKYRLD